MNSRRENPLLNAYYFRHHMYTLVPRHVREDMEWMADCGTDAVSLAVLEQDLFAAGENMDIICREADRVGMKVHAVPSRWGNLVAGAPKVPSTFASTHPEAVATDENGEPRYGPKNIGGAQLSVHHPETRRFFTEALEKLLTEWPFEGVIWDEIKNADRPDYSDDARAALGERIDDHGAHLEAVAAFFGELNRHIKAVKPSTAISLFLYSQCTGLEFSILARIEGLDYFGCDGRPWAADDGGSAEDRLGEKCLLDHAPRFIAEARKHGKRGLILIENHNMPVADIELLDRRLPDTLALGAEHVLYYYYPRNVPDPDRQMEIIARHLRDSKR